MQKKSPSAHHRTTFSGYICATKACIEIGEKLLNSNIFSTYSHNMVNFGPLTAEMLVNLGHRSKFQRVSRLRFITAATMLNVGQPNFTRCLAISWAATLYIHVWRLLPPNGILPGATFTLCPSLNILLYWQRYCTTLEQCASTKLCGV